MGNKESKDTSPPTPPVIIELPEFPFKKRLGTPESSDSSDEDASGMLKVNGDKRKKGFLASVHCQGN